MRFCELQIDRRRRGAQVLVRGRPALHRGGREWHEHDQPISEEHCCIYDEKPIKALFYSTLVVVIILGLFLMLQCWRWSRPEPSPLRASAAAPPPEPEPIAQAEVVPYPNR